MSNNRNTDNSAYMASLLAALVTVLLVTVYFLVESYVKDLAWKGFLQSISVNILAVTLSFLILYIFITGRDALGNSRGSSQKIFNELDYRVNQLKSDIFSRIDSISNRMAGEINTKLDLESNSSFAIKFDLLKSELASQMQQMSKQIGKEVNTKLDLDSNELYSFYGLKDARIGVTFQNFSVSRDADNENVNAISFLWADTLFGNTINAKIINEMEPFLRVEFQSFEPSWGCNIAIRPQNDRAVEIKSQDLSYLFFLAKIPVEALQDLDLLHDIGIAIRLVNGKYQHWDYASNPGQYIQFPLKSDGGWSPICIDLQDEKKWSHFNSDGNPNINEDERSKADLSIISAVILKFGKLTD